MRGILKDDNTLIPVEWFDQPDADDILNQKLEEKPDLRPLEHPLREFIHKGYTIIDLHHDHDSVDRLANEFDVFWEARYPDLLVAHNQHNRGRPQPMCLFPEDMQRGPSTRITDVQSHSASARNLMLNEDIHQFVHALYGGQNYVTQTLLFEYGSSQPLHRDPWYVQTNPPSSMVAAWVALEDIAEDSGPLNYVSGSQQWPYYRFPTNDILFNEKGVEDKERQKALEHLRQQVQDAGGSTAFMAKKGQALLWHHSLVHGGSPVANPARTRKSYVMHFDKLPENPIRHAAWVANGEHIFTCGTTQMLRRENRLGLSAPFSTLSDQQYRHILEWQKENIHP